MREPAPDLHSSGALSRSEARLELASALTILSEGSPVRMRLSRQRAYPGAFRGKAREFKRAIARAHEDAALIAPEEGEWWDTWHFHADWRGRGNLSWRYRRRYLEALIVVLRRIAAVRDDFRTPFQSWLYLSGRDAGEDAVYLHTPSPNPNGTPFPVRLIGTVQWGVRVPEAQLERLLPELPLRVGLVENHDEYAEPPGLRTSAFIYSPAIGVPLEGESPA